MTTQSRLQTVVADTSALVSLAVPRADATVDDALLDPLQYVLTSCSGRCCRLSGRNSTL